MVGVFAAWACRQVARRANNETTRDRTGAPPRSHEIWALLREKLAVTHNHPQAATRKSLATTAAAFLMGVQPTPAHPAAVPPCLLLVWTAAPLARAFVTRRGSRATRVGASARVFALAAATCRRCSLA